MNSLHEEWPVLSFTVLAAVGGLAAVHPPCAVAAQYLSIEQAQQAAFPEADRFVPRVIHLSAEQLHQLEAVAQVRERGEIRQIEAWAGSRLLGTLYVDDVIGKVDWITYTIAVAPDGSLRSLDILEYRETHGFEVRTAAWRKQFAGRRADTPFLFGDDIKNITGATLSCSHLTAGVQRLLSLHAQLAHAPK